MPQIERLLSSLAVGESATLRLKEGHVAAIENGDESREITRGPVTGPQMVAILREVAPCDAAWMLDQGAAVDYTFRSGGVVFRVQASRPDGQWRAVVVVAAPETSAPSESEETRTDASAARTTSDQLLAITISRRASDLQLRCGEPPTVRRDGAIERMGDRDVLTAVDVRAMIDGTIPARNRAECELHGDSDYAYERDGKARFRVNVFTDRKGPRAETGHLVFATLHTATAASTIDRVVDQCPADQQERIRVMFADALRAIIAQTLCRRIGGGRVAAREVLFNTAPIANLIRERKTCQIPIIMQTSRRQGMTMLNDALVDLVEAGTITADGSLSAFLRKGLSRGGVASLRIHASIIDRVVELALSRWAGLHYGRVDRRRPSSSFVRSSGRASRSSSMIAERRGRSFAGNSYDPLQLKRAHRQR